jgi:hypothetical protein
MRDPLLGLAFHAHKLCRLFAREALTTKCQNTRSGTPIWRLYTNPTRSTQPTPSTLLLLQRNLLHNRRRLLLKVHIYTWSIMATLLRDSRDTASHNGAGIHHCRRRVKVLRLNTTSMRRCAQTTREGPETYYGHATEFYRACIIDVSLA